ncbi:DUF305 domain-containing protein [Streptomyces chartreusis]
MTDFATTGPKKALVAALLCALTVSGCAGATQPSGPTAARTAATGSSGTGSSPEAISASRGSLTATDIGWIQLMIAMDDQARHILQLAPERSDSTDLKGWAADTTEHHRAELATLRALLAEAAIPDDNPHEGHDMPGMVNTRELQALTTARGPHFDRLLRSAMLEHFTQARKLAASVRKAEASAEVKLVALATGRSAADSQRRLQST